MCDLIELVEQRIAEDIERAKFYMMRRELRRQTRRLEATVTAFAVYLARIEKISLEGAVAHVGVLCAMAETQIFMDNKRNATLTVNPSNDQADEH